ncbi:5685_t:CDS:1, partial [Dentiscutata heterogama]
YQLKLIAIFAAKVIWLIGVLDLAGIGFSMWLVVKLLEVAILVATRVGVVVLASTRVLVSLFISFVMSVEILVVSVGVCTST